MTPTVTVVIALYNKARFVKKTIESVLAQTYVNFALLIVDDGSTDGSKEIVAQIQDKRITLLSIKNSGPGVARNTGLALADTKYVSFIDADDQWHPDFLKQAITTLEINQHCDVWLCGAVWQPQGEYRLPFLEHEKTQQDSGPWKLDTTYNPLETAEVVNFFATGAVVAKAETIKKYHGYFDFVRCTSGEDGYLWLQVMYNHTLYRDKEALLIINTDGSDLGIGRRSLKPIPPWLAYPKPIISGCPLLYKKSLMAYFNLSAFYAYRREVYQGNIGKALYLLWHYPKLSLYRVNYPPVGLALVWYSFKYYVRLLLNK